MSDHWSFNNPVAIRFGSDIAEEAVSSLPYRRMLLVTTPGMTRRGVVERFRRAAAEKIQAVHDAVAPNPELDDLDSALAARRRGDFDAIIALGGGSALDTGKILGWMLGTPSGFTLRDHFIGDVPLPGEPRPLPVVAIPTTAGTGSEVTPFATVWDRGTAKKYSLAHPLMFPKLAVVDPAATTDLPWEVTLPTGLDAFCQACESIWNRHANPITIGYAFAAAELAWGALSKGQALVGSATLRSDLMRASLLAGLAISHTRTALCHSISYPLTSRFGLEHGFACAVTMPAVWEFVAETHPALMTTLAGRLSGGNAATFTGDLVRLWRFLEVPKRCEKVFQDGSFLRELAPQMISPGRADNIVRPANVSDVVRILSRTDELLFR